MGSQCCGTGRADAEVDATVRPSTRDVATQTAFTVGATTNSCRTLFRHWACFACGHFEATRYPVGHTCPKCLTEKMAVSTFPFMVGRPETNNFQEHRNTF